jgi:hypothetical protein
MKSLKTAIKFFNLTGHFEYHFLKDRLLISDVYQDTSGNYEKGFIFNQVL